MNRRDFISKFFIGSCLIFSSGSLLGCIETQANPTKQKDIKKLKNPKLQYIQEDNIKGFPTGIIFHPSYYLYQGPSVGSFIERPDRLIATVNKITNTKEVNELPFFLPTHISDEYILKVHSSIYLDHIKKMKNLYKNKSSFISHQKNYNKDVPPLIPNNISPYIAASLSVGGAIKAVDLVMKKHLKNVFSLIRPPGHHANSNRYMGFCIFNNVAIAARYAQQKYKIKNILIVDWDVHHGNGTQEIFYSDPTVLYFSVHQYGLYPTKTGYINEVGVKKGIGYNINVPLPPRTGPRGYQDTFELMDSIVYSFKPELILVSAGQDAHYNEKIAKMRLNNYSYAILTKKVKQWAHDLCNDKLILLLEGGYNPYSTSHSIINILRTLADIPIPKDEYLNEKIPKDINFVDYKNTLNQVFITQSKYWKNIIIPSKIKL